MKRNDEQQDEAWAAVSRHKQLTSKDRKQQDVMESVQENFPGKFE